MFLALIRFILFETPSAFLRGLAFIIFDKEEIIGERFDCRRLRKKINKEQILKNYLEKCYKQLHQDEENGKKKRLD